MGFTKQLTLVGVDGSVWDLWRPGTRRPNEITLRAVPDLEAWPVQHIHAASVGQRGASWGGAQVTEKTMTLTCKIVGDNVHRVVSWFLDAIGDGEETCQMVASSADYGEWAMRARYSAVSEIDWWGDAAHPVGAEFEVTLVQDDPAWQGEPVALDFGPPDLNTGTLYIPHEGDLACWPVITVTGGVDYHVTEFGFNNDPMMVLPHRAEGWRIVTDPAKRLIADATGAEIREFAGEQPFWPNPPKLKREDGGARFFEINTGQLEQSATYTFTVSFTPERKRPW